MSAAAPSIATTDVSVQLPAEDQSKLTHDNKEEVSGNQLILDAVAKACPSNDPSAASQDESLLRPSNDILSLVKYPSDARFLEVFMTKEKRLNQRIEVEPEVFIAFDVLGPDSAPEKLVAIMGLMGHRSDYSITVNAILAKHPDTFQVVVIDNRGIGGSSAPATKYTTKMMAEDALKVVDSLHWEKFHVAGISMGGMISQQLALLAKDRVKSLTLMVTHAGGSLSRPGMFQLTGYWNLAKMMWFHNTPEGMAQEGIKNLYSQGFLDEVSDDKSGRVYQEQKVDVAMAKLKFLQQNNRVISAEGRSGQLSAVQSHRVADEDLKSLRDYNYPILVVGATKDRLIHHRNSVHIYELVKSPLATYLELDSGHGVIGEHIDTLTDAIVDNMLKGSSKI